MNALFHHVDLLPPERRVQRDKLTVEVCDADNIVVHQRNRAYAGTGQGFGCK